MSTYGPRFSHGYQFPRTSSARLTREAPIRREEVPGVGYAQIVPLVGGRRRLFDVCAVWTDPQRNGYSSTYIATDELEARAEFVKLMAELRR